MSKDAYKRFMNLLLLFIGALIIIFCLFLYLGGDEMSNLFDDSASGMTAKITVFVLTCIVCIAFGILSFISIFCMDSKKEEIPVCNSGISVIYTSKKKETKICVLKYYDSSSLEEFTKNLDKDDVIYVPHGTEIEKEFFEKLNATAADYRITFTETYCKIKIIEKTSE